MSDFDPSTHPHRRLNPLTNEYVLISPHRTKRPWLGQTETPPLSSLPSYDPVCYLCPGNSRAGGLSNPPFDGTYVFENDFAAVLPPPGPSAPVPPHPLLTVEPVQGGCDVLIFHPRHDMTLALLSIPDIIQVIQQWIAIYEKRGQETGIKYVQIFENKGAMMGCSNPHPHGQVWSLSAIPSLPATELAALRNFAYSDPAGSAATRGHLGLPCLLCEYAYTEMRMPDADGRIVVKNSHWVALVPWWAVWPFEILLLPYHRHISSLSELTPEEISSFAQILSEVTVRYDNLFTCPFAYSMGIHQRPVPLSRTNRPLSDDDSFAHLHLHFYPPLLRSASVRKFLVGFELLSEPQRDLTPEQAATCLRNCSEVHYLHNAPPNPAAVRRHIWLAKVIRK